MASESKPGALIQVVEDDPHLNMAICETLRSYGFSVESFPAGVQALEWLKEHRPDVILCDIMMPGMDGYTLLRHTRADPQLRTLPFIFLTARTSVADQRLAREIGVEDYLTKPIDSENLVIAIRNALRRQRVMQEEMQRQLDNLRHRIVNVLQHEFRTPLTFVLGYAEYLLETINSGVDLDELRDSIGVILDGGHRLQRLIEGFLLLAELQSYVLRAEDSNDVIAINLWKGALPMFETPLQEAGLQVEIANRNQHVIVNGNADLLQEALRRLLDNAIRYRRPTSQRIQLSVERLPPYVGLRIQDDGVGMTPEQVQALAKPFEQADRDNRTTPGAGISLAVVRHVVILHGGKLDIESASGQGTTVTVWLPIAPSSPES
jgi:signal transduction histidine kinase